MAGPVIRFKDSRKDKVSKKAVVGQAKQFPVAMLLYSDTPNLPDSLSQNAMLYTTDTGKVFIGTGDSIKMINVTEDVERKLEELKESVYSKQEIDDFIDKDINLDGIIDRLNTYTVERANELLGEKAAEITQVHEEVDRLRSDVNANLAKNYVRKSDFEGKYYTKEEVDEIVANAVQSAVEEVMNKLAEDILLS